MVFLNAFRDGLWPEGKLKSASIPRSAEEKLNTRDEANRKLSALMPGTRCLIGVTEVSLTGSERLGRQHDWQIQCKARGAPYLRCIAESTSQPTHHLHNHRRGEQQLNWTNHA
jgi:hypothetical protein